MSVLAAMPPLGMTISRPNFTRPCIPSWTEELYRQFRETCRSEVFEDVCKLVDAEPRSSEYLTECLLHAVLVNNLPIVKYLLNKGATTNRAIPGAAAHVKSLTIFKLLLEDGWNINASAMANQTVLP